ncbi:4Fe-4S binding protein [Methanobacterium subterraneum]|uniref:4Fe-4S binding protein n=1 Tax=Methanobacterium subterraneum TaxID=59277 RepID=UPI001F42DEF0|nr:4Fe-4S binding protein [Methanobacterium subterraneum]
MKFWWVRPAIDPEKCNQCLKCQGSCPTHALKKPGTLTKDQRAYIPEFDYEKCINCLCCMEMCPQKAIYHDQSLIYRLISKFSNS